MSKEEDFQKKFDEMIRSDDLKQISENFESEVSLETKDLVLIQQALIDAVSHISQVLWERVNESYDFVFSGDNMYHNLLSSLYKIAEDFNEVMMDYYGEFDDDDDDEGDISGAPK